MVECVQNFRIKSRLSKLAPGLLQFPDSMTAEFQLGLVPVKFGRQVGVDTDIYFTVSRSNDSLYSHGPFRLFVDPLHRWFVHSYFLFVVFKNKEGAKAY